MSHVTWGLSTDGYCLFISEFDPDSRKVLSSVEIRSKKPMTEEEAMKYVNRNYPKEGSPVGLAAEKLGIQVRKT